MITKSEMLEKISQRVNNATICEQIEKQIDEQIQNYNGVGTIRIDVDKKTINSEIRNNIIILYTKGGWEAGFGELITADTCAFYLK